MKILAHGIYVATDLGDKFVDGTEFFLGPNAVMENDVDFLAAEVFVEIEEVGFDGEIFLANGGRDADVHGGGECFSGYACLGDVDALGGDGAVVGLNIGCGESEFLAEASAGYDLADDGVFSSQEAFDALKVALKHALADEGAADALAVDDEGRHFFGGESVFGTEALEQGDVAFGSASESAIVSDDDGFGVACFVDDGAHEFGCANGGNGGVEIEDADGLYVG